MEEVIEMKEIMDFFVLLVLGNMSTDFERFSSYTETCPRFLPYYLEAMRFQNALLLKLIDGFINCCT